MMDTITELRQGIRQIQEYGFKEIEMSDKVSVVTHADMPWLPPEPKGFRGHIVQLARATTIPGESFYLGSLIRGSLVGEASSLTKDESDRANKLYYCAIQQFLNGSYDVRAVKFAKTESDLVPPEKRRKIWEASNGRGVTRVFFMQFGKIDNLPIFIRIAVSTGKPSEIDVLSQLVTQTRPEIQKMCLRK